MPGFSNFSAFLHNFVSAKIATSSIKVKGGFQPCEQKDLAY